MNGLVSSHPADLQPSNGDKPHFGDKDFQKALYLCRFGRGGGDRKHYRAEFQGVRRNAGER